MRKPKEGTVTWFERARRECVDHLRALNSIRMAHECVSEILTHWATNDGVTATGLHSASVIAYARPFTKAQTKFGNVAYPVSVLKKAPGFDRELHLHLMDLRNRLIAHADYGLLASTMYLQLIGDEKLPVAMGVNVKSMLGFEARSLAQRYQAHFVACMTSIEERLNRELREVATEAQKYPAEFHATHNVPVAMSELKPTTELTDFPGPTGPAGDVAEPSFPEGLSGYRYRTLQHQLPLIESGTYTIHERGSPKEVTFTVD